jgi:hypothetical protein
MALYLVIHTPRAGDAEGEAARPPTRLRDLAETSLAGTWPRWLKTWSPDLHDDRIISLWEARDAAEIEAALRRYGYLDDRAAEFLRVQEWGPAEVLAAEQTEPPSTPAEA